MSKEWDRSIDNKKSNKLLFDLFLSKFDMLIYAKYILIVSKSVKFSRNNLFPVSIYQENILSQSNY